MVSPTTQKEMDMEVWTTTPEGIPVLDIKATKVAAFREATRRRIIREQLAEALGLNLDAPLGRRIVARVQF